MSGFNPFEASEMSVIDYLNTNIPSEMKTTKNWVNVKFKKEDGQLVLNRQGKPIKVPTGTNGYNAKSNDSSTWSQFNDCVQLLESNTELKGIGYMLSLEDNYVFIDIDNINENKEEKMNFLNSFDSYTELSQSGTGYHIIVKVSDKKEFEQWARDNKLIGYGTKIKNTLSSKHGDYEAYIEKRYFWLTGKIVDNKSEIKEVSFERLKELFEYIESKRAKKAPVLKKAKKAPVLNTAYEMTNKEIIEKCKKSKQGEKFLELYNEPGDDGNSEGDQTILAMLAFYTQDVDQLCEIMRESPRYRDKFDTHPTYLENSAAKAVDCLTAAYDKNFYGDLDVITVREQGAELPEDMKELPWIHREELKNGKIKTTILCPILAKFLADQGRYLFVKYSAKSAINRYLYKDGCYRLIIDNEFKCYIKKYIPLWLHNMKIINEVMNLIYTDDHYVSVKQINPEKYINFENGLFNIETWQMEEHTPDIYTTIQIPCNYRPDMKPPTKSVFDKYMNTLASGNKETIKLIKQFMGVTISNIHGYRMKKSLFLVGKGDSGKSQIKALLSDLLGNENTSAIDMSNLERRFGTSAIYNKRLIGSNDMGFMTIKELKTYKLITGGDDIDFEYKNEGTFTDRYYGIVWNCANEMPKFGGDRGDWTYDRMIIVNCNNVIPKAKQDKKLKDKMFAEREYIVWQVMQNLKEVIDNGYNFDIPESCRLAVEEYKIANDSILSFMNECTVKIEDDKLINSSVNVAKMYDIYCKWCNSNNGGYTETKMKFKKILEQKGLNEIKKTNVTRFYKNFILTADALEEYNLIGF